MANRDESLMRSAQILVLIIYDIFAIRRYLKIAERKNITIHFGWSTKDQIASSLLSKLTDDERAMLKPIFLDLGPEEIESTAEQLRSLNLNAIIPGDELGVRASEIIARKLNLPHHEQPENSVFRDKFAMRQQLKKGGLPQPEVYLKLERADELTPEHLSKIPSYPVIVKAADLYASKGVRLCMTSRDVADAILAIRAIAIDGSIRDETQGSILVEQVIIGEEFTCDCVVFEGKLAWSGMTMKYLSPMPFRDEVGHCLGVDYSPNFHWAVRRMAEQVISALRLTFGHAHIEFKYDGNYCHVIEVGARLPGDFIVELFALQFGLSLEECLIATRSKQNPTPIISSGIKSRAFFGVKFFFQRDVDLPVPSGIDVIRDQIIRQETNFEKQPFAYENRLRYALLCANTLDKLTKFLYDDGYEVSSVYGM